MAQAMIEDVVQSLAVPRRQSTSTSPRSDVIPERSRSPLWSLPQSPASNIPSRHGDGFGISPRLGLETQLDSWREDSACVGEDYSHVDNSFQSDRPHAASDDPGTDSSQPVHLLQVNENMKIAIYLQLLPCQPSAKNTPVHVPGSERSVASEPPCHVSSPRLQPRRRSLSSLQGQPNFLENWHTGGHTSTGADASRCSKASSRSELNSSRSSVQLMEACHGEGTLSRSHFSLGTGTETVNTSRHFSSSASQPVSTTSNTGSSATSSFKESSNCTSAPDLSTSTDFRQSDNSSFKESTPGGRSSDTCNSCSLSMKSHPQSSNHNASCSGSSGTSCLSTSLPVLNGPYFGTLASSLGSSVQPDMQLPKSTRSSDGKGSFATARENVSTSSSTPGEKHGSQVLDSSEEQFHQGGSYLSHLEDRLNRQSQVSPDEAVLSTIAYRLSMASEFEFTSTLSSRDSPHSMDTVSADGTQARLAEGSAGAANVGEWPPEKARDCEESISELNMSPITCDPGVWDTVLSNCSSILHSEHNSTFGSIASELTCSQLDFPESSFDLSSLPSLSGRQRKDVMPATDEAGGDRKTFLVKQSQETAKTLPQKSTESKTLVKKAKSTSGSVKDQPSKKNGTKSVCSSCGNEAQSSTTTIKKTTYKVDKSATEVVKTVTHTKTIITKQVLSSGPLTPTDLLPLLVTKPLLARLLKADCTLRKFENYLTGLFIRIHDVDAYGTIVYQFRLVQVSGIIRKSVEKYSFGGVNLEVCFDTRYGKTRLKLPFTRLSNQTFVQDDEFHSWSRVYKLAWGQLPSGEFIQAKLEDMKCLNKQTSK